MAQSSITHRYLNTGKSVLYFVIYCLKAEKKVINEKDKDKGNYSLC